MGLLVDTHVHVISPDTQRYPLQPIGGVQSSWSQAHSVTHLDLMDAMDEAGIDKAVVVQASTAYGFDNSYLAEAVAAHPGRMTGVFAVDVLARDAVSRIKYWQSQGLTGLRLFTAGSTMEGQADWLNDPRSYDAWAYASEVALPICVQMRPEGLPQLSDLLQRFPEAIVLLDHLARPVLEDGPPFRLAAGLWELAACPRLNVKLTLRTLEAAQQGRSTIPAFLAQLLSTFGADRVVWGSNYPAAGKPLPELVRRALDGLASLGDDDRARIMGGTALRLYPALTRG